MGKLIPMKDYHDLKSSEMKVYLIEGKVEMLAAMFDTASSKKKNIFQIKKWLFKTVFM